MIKQGAQAEQLAVQYLQQQGLRLIAQQRIISTAQQYLAGFARIPACRFDVVLLDGVEAHNMQWLKNAFDA